jgi:hypothetical protein
MGNVLTRREQALVASLLPGVIEQKQQRIDQAMDSVRRAQDQLEDLQGLHAKLVEDLPTAEGGGGA